MNAAWHWWTSWAAIVCAAAMAGEPPAPPAPAGEVVRPAARTVDPAAGDPAAGDPASGDPNAVPDDDFIEFLGRDDVGDAALLAFLKKSAQRRDTPPQDAKQ